MSQLLYTVEVKFAVPADQPGIVAEKLQQLREIAEIGKVKAKAKKEDDDGE